MAIMFTTIRRRLSPSVYNIKQLCSFANYSTSATVTAKPVVASLKPIRVNLIQGEHIWFCVCGRSKTQPYCDGSHEGTGIEPLEFVVPETKQYRT